MQPDNLFKHFRIAIPVEARGVFSGGLRVQAEVTRSAQIQYLLSCNKVYPLSGFSQDFSSCLTSIGLVGARALSREYLQEPAHGSGDSYTASGIQAVFPYPFPLNNH
jgi:hypothetical protein